MVKKNDLEFNPVFERPKREIRTVFSPKDPEAEVTADRLADGTKLTPELAAKIKSDLIEQMDNDIKQVDKDIENVFTKIGDFKITVPEDQPAIREAIMRFDTRNDINYNDDGSINTDLSDFYNMNNIDMTLLYDALDILYSGESDTWV